MKDFRFDATREILCDKFSKLLNLRVVYISTLIDFDNRKLFANVYLHYTKNYVVCNVLKLFDCFDAKIEFFDDTFCNFD